MVIVADSSPLICFAILDKLSVLDSIFDSLIVPEEVYNELVVPAKPYYDVLSVSMMRLMGTGCVTIITNRVCHPGTVGLKIPVL